MNQIMEHKKIIRIGIIGGGQLAKMLAEAAFRFGYEIHVYSDSNSSPACQVTPHVIVGEYADQEKLFEFAANVDLITYEFENINHVILEKINHHYGFVFPSPRALYTSKNRLREKNMLNLCGAKTAKFKAIDSYNQLYDALIGSCKEFNFPVILKTNENGYDGKGQYRIYNQEDLELLQNNIVQSNTKNNQSNYIIEEFIDYILEFSIICARGHDSKIVFFPITQNLHKDGILRESNTNIDCKITHEVIESAKHIIKRVADELSYVGVFTIEFFLCENGDIIANEMAPRVHNSGHHSLDSSSMSQFEAHIRAVAGLDFPVNHNVKLLRHVKMINLIGKDALAWKDYLKNENAQIYLYGKDQVKDGRKMGHVNVLID